MPRKKETAAPVAAEDFEPDALGHRFWSKVDCSGGAEACWPWTAYRDKDGYGVYQTPRGPVRAHRLVLRAALKRPLRPGECGRHRCNNPPCCNPGHLLPGSRADNRQDCVFAARHAFGERHSSAKLTEAEVGEIKEKLPASTIRGLAREYGVRHWVIQQIRDGKIWRQLINLGGE